MFRSEYLALTHGVDLPRPAAVCLDLFTPKGELAWIPTWAPTFLHPADGTTQAGMVFETRHDGVTTTWVMTEHAPEAGRVAYVRITPGLRAVALSVICRPDGEGDGGGAGCRVAVAYNLTGLSEAGNAANRDFAAGFAAMIDGWRDLILAHFDRVG